MAFRISLFSFLAIILILSSCSKGKMCEDVDLGLITNIDEGTNHMDIINIDTMVYLDQDSNFIYFPISGTSTENYNREIRYKCTDDGYFQTANYKIELNTRFAQIMDSERYLKIEQQTELPFKNNVESPGANARSVIKNKFANQVKVYIFDDGGSPIKLNLFTKTNDPETDLDLLNQANNRDLKFHESIILNGKEYFNVYSTKQNVNEDFEVFYSVENGLIQFTDKMNNTLTFDRYIFY